MAGNLSRKRASAYICTQKGGDRTMTPRSGKTAPSPGALRMRISRDRRRQGDVIAKLEIGPNITADLVALGWLLAPDRVDRDALASALVGLIDRAIEVRVTPSMMESESIRFTPLRVTAGPIAIGSDENARQSPKPGMLAERVGPQELLGLGDVEPDEVLAAADGAAEIVEDKPPEAQPCDTASHQPFEVDPVRLWGPRLSLWLSRRMWMSAWGPRPDQDGCQAPSHLL
jgi:hypothetical protein